MAETKKIVKSKETIGKEAIKKELMILMDQKAKLVAQINQLQEAIKNGESNFRQVIDTHNRTQAQIDILEKILK